MENVPRKSKEMEYIVGIDIGGTGTDCVVMDEKGVLTVGKAFSTPPDFTDGVLDSAQVAAGKLGLDLSTLLENTRLLLHSSTVADNAIVQGKLAKGGLLITKGFEETLFMTRGAYGRWAGLSEEEIRNPIEPGKPPPIVPLSMIRGIKERTDYKGQILLKADEGEIDKSLRELLEKGAEAIGVCFLWSFRNPDNENKVKKVLQSLNQQIFFTCSNELAPVMGEYERSLTVALNISLGPQVSAYLTNLRRVLEGKGFKGMMLIMQAYGGLVKCEEASSRPVGMIESGPAGGLVGSKLLGNILGFDHIIAADMGGTTFKAGVIRQGMIEYQWNPIAFRYPYSLPKMDIVSIGLAGGSIVLLDPRTNMPQIGPRSAGAYPGPVCYGFGGTEPTITDIDLLLGYLKSELFLEGRAKLDIRGACEAFKAKIADPLRMDIVEAASEVYRLANSLIYDMLHKMTVEKGLDPRGYVLFSYGGTAGMHMGTVAQELGVRSVIIPHTAAVHGAYGLISADIVHEDRITRPMGAQVSVGAVNDIFAVLRDRTVRQLKSEGFKDEDIEVHRAIDMRYRRQIHTTATPVEVKGDLTEADLQKIFAAYERLYEERYGKGSAYREAGIEMTTFRVRATGLLRKPKLGKQELAAPDPRPAFMETRKAYFPAAKGMIEAEGYDFDKMLPGNEVNGPSIIWTPITTIVVNPGQKARVDEYRNIILTW